MARKKHPRQTAGNGPVSVNRTPFEYRHFPVDAKAKKRSYAWDEKQNLVNAHWRAIVETEGVLGIAGAVDDYVAQVLTAIHGELVVVGDRLIARGLGRYDNTLARVQHSSFWYAEKAGNLVRDLRGSVTRSETSSAAKQSFLLAVLMTEWQVNEEWSVPALSGKKIMDARLGGAAVKNSERHEKKKAQGEELQKLADEYRGRHPNAPKARVAKHIWDNHKDHRNLEEETIAKNIK